MSNIGKNNSNAVPIILAGLAAGAALWYFLRTEKGRETSEALVSSLEDFGNSFKEKAVDSFNKISDQALNIKEKAVDTFNKASGNAESAFSDYESSTRNI
ncbi:MAG: hypothetical protein JWQ25_2802 [Daejeonella sp.]|nr:hypothetical protein [Daejeonella sp.]